MTSAARLLRWYDAHGRDLPWRKTRDPYRILVSEIMLQQTQVPRVVLFYARWLKKFPDWQALSRASNADVIHAWAGLGYNRRALVLRDIARRVVADGEPNTEQEWLALKGIGPYTAAAIGSFSLHERTFPIDTTIRRAADRLLLGAPFPDPKKDEKLRRAGLTFLTKAPQRFYDVPQALFDLATAVCKKDPACAICPMRTVCPAAPKFLSGRVKIPKAMIRKAKESRHRDKPYPDRIYRGRILKLVREARDVVIASLGKRIDPSFKLTEDQAWLLRMVDRMEKDGMVARNGSRVRLAR